MKFTYKFFMVIWFIFAMVSIVLFFHSVSNSSNVKKLISNGSSTTGVFAMHEDNNITFTVDNTDYTIMPRSLFFNREKGESVTVHYDADDPSSACYEGEEKELLWEEIAMCVLSFLFLFSAYAYKYKAENL